MLRTALCPGDMNFSSEWRELSHSGCPENVYETEPNCKSPQVRGWSRRQATPTLLRWRLEAELGVRRLEVQVSGLTLPGHRGWQKVNQSKLRVPQLQNQDRTPQATPHKGGNVRHPMYFGDCACCHQSPELWLLNRQRCPQLLVKNPTLYWHLLRGARVCAQGSQSFASAFICVTVLIPMCACCGVCTWLCTH